MFCDSTLLQLLQIPGFRKFTSLDFKGRKQEVNYVLENGVAKKRTVNIGLTNFDYIEILDNLQAGEEVIITDMKDYVHLAEVAIE